MLSPGDAALAEGILAAMVRHADEGGVILPTSPLVVLAKQILRGDASTTTMVAVIETGDAVAGEDVIRG